MPSQDQAPMEDADLESMLVNLKEGDRYIVNHNEDLMAIDFSGYVSLAEKEDVGMARRGDLARGRPVGEEEEASIKQPTGSGYDSSRRALLGGEGAVCQRSDPAVEVARLRRRATTATAVVATVGLRLRLGCGWKDPEEKDLTGLEGVTRACPRFLRGRGALDVFHDRGGRGKTWELSVEEVAIAAEETAAGTNEAMVPAISQKYLAEESTTMDRRSTTKEGDDGEDDRPGRRTSEGYHQ
ncbi:hypothetical protein GW17_00051912 [Ensete ventricosum]|nr:hypothetical protein GW17_00051912 [Ensete ventricosum]